MYSIKMKSFLCQLARSNKNSFPGIIKHAKRKDFRRLVDLTLDVMRKRIDVEPKLQRLIKQNRRQFRHLVHPSFSLKSKKRYLLQKGGAKFPVAIRALGSAAVRGITSAGRWAAGVSPPSGMQLRGGTRLLSQRQLQQAAPQLRAAMVAQQPHHLKRIGAAPGRREAARAPSPYDRPPTPFVRAPTPFVRSPTPFAKAATPVVRSRT